MVVSKNGKVGNGFADSYEKRVAKLATFDLIAVSHYETWIATVGLHFIFFAKFNLPFPWPHHSMNVILLQFLSLER